MVFSSPIFLFFFLPLVLLATLLAGGLKARNTVLLIASLFFYAWGEGIYVLLMLALILCNYLCGLAIEYSQERKPWLVVAIVVNIGALLWFKYANFLSETASDMLGAFGLPPILLDPIALPIGVSFYIFHGLSYVIDVYRKDAKAQASPGIAALYISLFPQLVAGPIIRYHDVAQQFTERTMDIPRFASGVRRFVVGLAKKILIADQCARIADPIFQVPIEHLNAPVVWLGTAAYAVQIYFDFSGYSDMAIGLGRMLGFDFLENFNRPYIASSVRDFWRRWHISLGNWFRDYLYKPLGGNRRGAARTYLNLFIVFLLTGLWHGASWSFVVWGLIHGSFMVLERARFGALLDRWPRLVGTAYTLLVVLIAWVFFRVENIADAAHTVSAMFGFGRGCNGEVYPSLFLTNITTIALVVGVLGSLDLHTTAARWFRISPSGAMVSNGPRGAVEVAGVMCLLVLCAMSIASNTFSPFIYFRF